MHHDRQILTCQCRRLSTPLISGEASMQHGGAALRGRCTQVHGDQDTISLLAIVSSLSQGRTVLMGKPLRDRSTSNSSLEGAASITVLIRSCVWDVREYLPTRQCVCAPESVSLCGGRCIVCITLMHLTHAQTQVHGTLKQPQWPR
jgi:hypothetical protein